VSAHASNSGSPHGFSHKVEAVSARAFHSARQPASLMRVVSLLQATARKRQMRDEARLGGEQRIRYIRNFVDELIDAAGRFATGYVESPSRLIAMWLPT
jgi:hypothetical protein